MRVSSPQLRFHNTATLNDVFNPETFANRRRKLMQELPDKSLVIVPNNKIAMRNHEVEFKFRPDSDFYYLTGIDEPNSVCVLRKEENSFSYVLFVEPNNIEKEIWIGKKIGLKGAKTLYGADESYSIEDFDKYLDEFVKGAQFIYFPLGFDRHLDLKVLRQIGKLKDDNRAAVPTPEGVFDVRDLVHKMRLIKEKEELDNIQRACDISNDAHILAMREAKPGMHEYELEALIDSEFRSHGGVGPAYGSIVGSGNNATVLHYTQNTRKLQKGDLVLIDAGSEFDYYASDITRTFPASGKFTEPQKDIYRIVLEAQEKTIEKAVPGVRYIDLYNEAVMLIAQGLKELGLLKGSVEKIIESKEYKRFFMHRIGHWMGLDVHDAGPYLDEEGKSIKLQPGMVLTVEPGIYIPSDSKDVPKRYRGIGIRIEDDVLITKSGNKVLTEDVPKSIEEIEDIRN